MDRYCMHIGSAVAGSVMSRAEDEEAQHRLVVNWRSAGECIRLIGLPTTQRAPAHFRFSTVGKHYDTIRCKKLV